MDDLARGGPAQDGIVGAVDPATGEPAGTVVWLHGMGQDAEAMRRVARRCGLVGSRVRQVYLQAPSRPVGLLATRPVRAWMVQTVSQLGSADTDALRTVAVDVRAVIDRELSTGRPVVLAGFSQGAALALMLAMTHPARLAGVAAYAPFLLRDRHASTDRFDANRQLPVWLGHGRADGTIPIGTGRAIRDGLRNRGYRVQWHEYPGGHESFAGADHDLVRFVEQLTTAGPR